MSEPKIDEIRARYPSMSVNRRLAIQAPLQMAVDIHDLLAALEHAERAVSAKDAECFRLAAQACYEPTSSDHGGMLCGEVERLRTRLAEAEQEAREADEATAKMFLTAQTLRDGLTAARAARAGLTNGTGEYQDYL